ncbi:hypothetical protein C8J56DRAFT_1046421 [Mycena floridula]|nr:hypothetical protein C8J56DRAFT_1046421 [Mycena floridula]
MSEKDLSPMNVYRSFELMYGNPELDRSVMEEANQPKTGQEIEETDTAEARLEAQKQRRLERRKGKEEIQRRYRQMQGDNRALRRENLEMEGQCQQLTVQVQSLSRISTASTDMIFKLRKEIALLRRQLGDEAIAVSMRRLGDLVPYPHNLEITLQLSAAIKKLEEDDAMLFGGEESESDEEPGRGSPTSSF